MTETASPTILKVPLMRTIVMLTMLLVANAAAVKGQDYEAQALEDVLVAECFDGVNRRSALTASRTEDKAPELWWQSGYIKLGEHWMPFEEAMSEGNRNARYQKYQRVQGKENLIAARWCLRNKQRDRYRAHMTAAIAREPKVATDATLAQMGWIRVDGRWASPEEAYNLVKEVQRVYKSTSAWGEELAKIRRELSGTASDIGRATHQLREINSANAVQAIHQILGTGDARCQRLAVETLARIDSSESSQLLAEYATYNPLESVRLKATEALKSRPWEDFVPVVLRQLRFVSPIDETKFLMVPWTIAAGVIKKRFSSEGGIRIQLKTESVNKVELQTAWLTVRTIHLDEITESTMGSWNADFRSGGLWATEHGRRKVLKLDESRGRFYNVAETQKERLKFTNDRAIAALSSISGEESQDPRFWWDWWNRHTDVDAPEKEIVHVIEVEERLQETVTVAASCFAAGTPVLTDSGTRAIETLRLGDRVLSQDPDTGELRFRVVEKTTIRKARPTRLISFSSEQIQCTGGHNFWKAGVGWVKARDLEVGDRIRTPTGTEAVTAVAKGEPVKTYNLVVEGFHTYFVGDSKLLVQDVLPITPTDNVLPGFSKFELGEDAPKSDRNE